MKDDRIAKKIAAIQRNADKAGALAIIRLSPTLFRLRTAREKDLVLDAFSAGLSVGREVAGWSN